MITSDEAKQITAGSLSEEKAQKLLDEVEMRIRIVATAGQGHLTVSDTITSAEHSYLRIKLKERGFEVSEVGLTIYWQ